MNAHALLVIRFLLTVAVLAVVAGLMYFSIVHPLDGGAQRLADALMGGMLTLLTGSCYAWFFNSSAAVAQANSTIAEQGKMLANSQPVVPAP